MNVISKLVTALRGGLNEAGEALADSQALRILDQELRDASEELNQTRANLATLIARHKLSEEKVAALQVQISEHEGYALKAMEIDDVSLARDVASQIAELEAQSVVEKASCETLGQSVRQLRKVAELASRELSMLKQQVSTLRVNQSVHRAQASVSARYGGDESRLQTAKDSLQRLQQQQDLESRTLAASQELQGESSSTSLKQRLEAAGIKPATDTAEAVLERLRKRQEK